MTRDETRRAVILAVLLFAVCAFCAWVAPCDGSCTVAEEVRRG